MLILPCIAAASGCAQQGKLPDDRPEIISQPPPKAIRDNNVKTADYDHLKEEILRIRDSLAVQYSLADSAGKEAIIMQAGEFVFEMLLARIFPAWCGTAFDMHGTTEIPGQGGIAGGYFVTTTLKHAGFQFPKTNGIDSMAIQPSEYIIRNLVSDQNQIGRFTAAPMKEIKDFLLRRGRGLYIVGLDYHVGFIINDDHTLKFIDASYYPPFAVSVSELDGDNALADSRYRVIGKILDAEMLRKWLQKEGFALRYNYFRKRN